MKNDKSDYNYYSYRSQQDSINLRELIMRCLRNWYWFVGSVVVFLIVVLFYYFSHNPQFHVSSSLMLRQEQESMLPQDEILSLVGITSSKNVLNELEILNSRTIMGQTVRLLDLQTEYRKKENLRWVGQYPTPDVRVQYPPLYLDTMRRAVVIELQRTANAYKVKVIVGPKFHQKKSKHILNNLDQPFNTCAGELRIIENKTLEVGDKMLIRTLPHDVRVDAFKTKISASQIKKESDVVRITTTTDMPKRAIDIMNKVTELYNLDAIVDKNMMMQNTAAFIDERLRIVTLELDTVEKAVEYYMQQNNLSDLSKEVEIALTTKSEYQKRIAEIQTQLTLVGYLREYLTDEKNAKSLVPLNIGLQHPTLQTLVADYNNELLEKMRISQSASPDNPILVQANIRLAELRLTIIETIKKIEESQKIEYDNLIAQDDTFNRLIRQAPAKERQYIEIKRQQQIKERLYLYLYEKREETALALAGAMRPARVIDPPMRDTSPVAPKLKLLLMLALLMGLALPIGVFYIYDIFNNKFTSFRQYEKAVRPPVLGQLINSKKAPIVNFKELSPATELFGMVRTNINFMLPKHPDKGNVILITSCINGEGKTFTSINLALSLATIGKRVVVVGLDIRKPMLVKYLGVERKGCLTSLLAGEEVDDSELILPTNISDNVHIVPAGIIPPNPAELITSDNLDKLVARLATMYDYVLLDTAPIALVSDTYVLNRLSDMTILVSRENYTPKDLAEFINDTYKQKRLNNIACIFNGVKPKKVSYGYGYGKSRYGYGYTKKS